MIAVLMELVGPFIPYVVAAVAALGGLWGWGRSQKAKGRDEAEANALKDSMKRQEKGREAVQDLRGASRDELVDRLRRNDGQWK